MKPTNEMKVDMFAFYKKLYLHLYLTHSAADSGEQSTKVFISDYVNLKKVLVGMINCIEQSYHDVFLYSAVKK